MIYNQILVRFGDLTLKGKNQNQFLRRLYNLVHSKLEGLNIEIENQRDRIFIHLLDEDYKKVIDRLNLVSGLYSYSLVVKCSNDLDEIKKNSLELMNEIVKENKTFK